MIPKRFLLVFGTFLLSVLLYVDRVCISAAEEPITGDLGLTEKQFGWVLSAFALGYALCQTPGGWLADRFGPRRILTAVVTFWSLFTGLTAAAFNFVSMLAARFLFGAGEAGAFPGISRAVFSWVPMAERGVVQGINFSGSRIGAACALPLVAWMIDALGWRQSFLVLMVVGFAWSIFWYLWFRDDPSGHPRITREELEHIQSSRQQPGVSTAGRSLSVGVLLRSKNVWLISCQYFCSNYTFFFCLTWLFPYLKETYDLKNVSAGYYSAAPFISGAIGNWVAGWLVDAIYRRGHWTLSRRVPAILGFVLAATGLVLSVYADPDRTSALWPVIWLSVAIFGADMTLSPSWSFCIDIGKQHSGVVSGTMNMAGNLGSFVTALAFPYLAEWTGSYTPFFFVAAALSLLAVVLWMFVRPERRLEEY
jgi:ACS family glucarate transporter-like MFS transporter